MRSPLPVEAERLVVNTGPLIALGRVGAFDIIGQLPVIFIVPKEVADEIEIGARAGYPVAMPAWATVHPLRAAIEPLGSHLLDAGEAAVIQLAIEQGIDDVCIDELVGAHRRCRGRRVHGARHGGEEKIAALGAWMMERPDRAVEAEVRSAAS
jgi:hypothetical protein